MEQAAHILQRYDRGAIIRSELTTRLVHPATAHAPADIAAVVPSDWPAEIRSEGARPPSCVEPCPNTVGFGRVPREEHRRFWYAGTRRWHDYFSNASNT